MKRMVDGSLLLEEHTNSDKHKETRNYNSVMRLRMTWGVEEEPFHKYTYQENSLCHGLHRHNGTLI